MEKIKNLFSKGSFSKEKLRDVFYISAMIVIVGLVVGSFIWSTTIIFKAVDAVFIFNKKEPEILSFNFEEFAKTAPRLGVVFSLETPLEESQAPVQTPVVETPIEIPATTTIETVSEIDLLTIDLEILNGTATKGLAAVWKEKFVSAGFNAEKIKTGNASKNDYSGATVFYNSQNNVFEKVMKVFEDNGLAVKEEIDDKLSASSFIAIIGK